MVSERRLLIVSLADRLGGAERSMLALAAELSRSPRFGWTPILALPPGEFADLAEAQTLQVRRVPWRRIDSIRHLDGRRHVLPYSALRVWRALLASWANVLLLRRLIGTTRCELVLSNSSAGHVFAAVAGRLARRPVVWHQRDIVRAGPGRVVLQQMSRLVRGIFAISVAVAETVPHPGLRVVQNPVDVPEDVVGNARQGERRTQPLLATARPVIGFIGRTDPEKGVEDLLRAMVDVPASLVIVGAPAYGPPGWAEALPQLAEDLGVQTTFAGWVDQPWSSLAAMDVLAVPSWNEPWGRVAAEALCAGVPVVATRAGGLTEIVTDGVDGLLVPPRDVGALHAALLRIAQDDDLRARLAAGTHGAMTRFSCEVHAETVARLLDEFLGMLPSPELHAAMGTPSRDALAAVTPHLAADVGAPGRVGIVYFGSYPDIRVTKLAEALVDAGSRVIVLARRDATGANAIARHPYADVVADRQRAFAGRLRIREVAPWARGLPGAVTMPYHFNPVWRRAIRDLVAVDQVEVLVFRDIPLLLAARSAAAGTGVPVILDMAENYPAVLAEWRRWEGRAAAARNGVLRNITLARRLERAALRRADAVVTVVAESAARATSVRGRGGVSVVENTPVLADLVAASPDAAAAAALYSPGRRELEIVYTGEIHFYRGIDTVIDASRMLTDRFGHDESVRFTLVGSGKVESQLRARAETAGVGAMVRFTGWVDEVMPYVDAADVGIVPPHASDHYHTTMPNKLYEYMAFGKPVLVSDVRPMARVVREARCGVVFRAGDAADLARAVVEMMDDERRAQWGAAGRVAVENRYNWRVDSGTFVDVVRGVATGSGGAQRR
ncbi:MAG: glycosyltransferase [Mycobacteriales bacterium]